jgi:hypothetical protein
VVFRQKTRQDSQRILNLPLCRSVKAPYLV